MDGLIGWMLKDIEWIIRKQAGIEKANHKHFKILCREIRQKK